ncbi:hypothetical protein C1924_13295 [Stenotrophomonas sp. ESTM1D_MKCIP4_1]|uniref:hypothetical protein n=1 Tax=Stenotrophomonas sp. ESTM1D_MKCIP4_1 TaxID=2072414 RepID=UPI000D540476|nr:hypothetical protein [Stenotrophomonas sp. ESTM1D_MKCIP4_1]AWH54085.1 hypothetical protein C1924_13295 [Stenotrophomonas sp. ESTM1D_MKCIP4_1]
MKIALLLPVLALASCAHPAPVGPPAAATPAVGSDRDAHGCIGSAGYQWCQRSGRCERPWELAQAQGVANTSEAIEAWCALPATPSRR